MRELKFRGKTKEYGNWIYGDLSIIGDRFFISDSERDKERLRSITTKSGFAEIRFKEVFSDSVSQFIGLLDKNDVEIYESDIVQGKNRMHEDWVINQKVHYIKGCFMFGNWNAHEYFNKHTEIEVVGDIYTNPELLENQ